MPHDKWNQPDRWRKAAQRRLDKNKKKKGTAQKASEAYDVIRKHRRTPGGSY